MHRRNHIYLLSIPWLIMAAYGASVPALPAQHEASDEAQPSLEHLPSYPDNTTVPQEPKVLPHTPDALSSFDIVIPPEASPDHLSSSSAPALPHPTTERQPDHLADTPPSALIPPEPATPTLLDYIATGAQTDIPITDRVGAHVITDPAHNIPQAEEDHTDDESSSPSIELPPEPISPIRVPAPNQITPHVITWFFQPAHKLPEESYSEDELAAIIGTIRSSQRNMIQQQRHAQLISGIPVLYKGAITFSNEHGQILLPRLQEEDTLTIIVTERPEPVLESPQSNTIQAWKLKDTVDAAWYTLTRIREGAKGTWTITREEAPDELLPDTAIIILAPPHAIEMTQEPHETDTGTNLILPDIYVTQKILLNPPALNQIPISRFFEPTRYLFAYAPENIRYSIMVAM